MVKVFIGNLTCTATPQELRELFEKYGKVTECDIVKNYGFVHMSNMSEAEEAIKNLNQHQLHGWRMNVELSKGRPKSTTKLHVSNLGEGVTSDVLRARFEEFGPVVECDIVKDYAFIHMERMEDAMEAIEKMDNTAFKGELSGCFEPVVFGVFFVFFWIHTGLLLLECSGHMILLAFPPPPTLNGEDTMSCINQGQCISLIYAGLHPEMAGRFAYHSIPLFMVLKVRLRACRG